MAHTGGGSPKTGEGFAVRARKSKRAAARPAGDFLRGQGPVGNPKSANGLSERRLVEAARGGDAEATRQLVERAAAPAWRWSRGFCRNHEDAADLAQDVLVTLMRSLRTFRGEASLSTWTYVVARRACARRQQRAGRTHSLEEPAHAHLLDRPDPRGGPARRLERRELSERLETAIASLPESQRAVLVLRDVEGLSASEVGRVLGLGERAVKSRLHRARLAVRERLAPWVAGHDAPPPEASCPETARLLSRYLEGELDATTCSRMERHVRGCAACGGTCASLRAVLGECGAYRARPVPRELQRAVRDAVGRLSS